MTDWAEVRDQKKQMLKQCFASLSEPEQKILLEVLRLEIANRHLNSPRVRQPLREYVEQVVR